MFLFFSNRWGCLGSLLISLAVTILLLLLVRAAASMPRCRFEAVVGRRTSVSDHPRTPKTCETPWLNPLPRRRL